MARNKQNPKRHFSEENLFAAQWNAVFFRHAKLRKSICGRVYLYRFEYLNFLRMKKIWNLPLADAKVEPKNMVNMAMRKPYSHWHQVSLFNKTAENILFGPVAAARVQNHAGVLLIPDYECIFLKGIKGKRMVLNHRSKTYNKRQRKAEKDGRPEIPTGIFYGCSNYGIFFLRFTCCQVLFCILISSKTLLLILKISYPNLFWYFEKVNEIDHFLRLSISYLLQFVI
jgi:hypothetical protein